MTWRQFINSKYNTKEYIEIVEDTGNMIEYWTPFEIFSYNDNDGVYSCCASSHFTDKNDNQVNLEKEIENNHQYNDPFTAECVFPNSNITVSKEGDQIEAQNIKEGQDIAYYNFETEKVEIGTVSKVYIHKKADSFVKYTFEDGSYLEATDYHPIYTKEGWKSYTRRNEYEVPKVGDKVKTETGYKKLVNIETYTGEEDCYDFAIITKEGNKVNNYFANGTLVESSIE